MSIIRTTKTVFTDDHRCLLEFFCHFAAIVRSLQMIKLKNINFQFKFTAKYICSPLIIISMKPVYWRDGKCFRLRSMMTTDAYEKSWISVVVMCVYDNCDYAPDLDTSSSTGVCTYVRYLSTILPSNYNILLSYLNHKRTKSNSFPINIMLPGSDKWNIFQNK